MNSWEIVSFGGDTLTEKVGPSDPLGAFATLARRATELVAEQTTEGIRFRIGRLKSHDEPLRTLENRPCTLRSPFESCESIAGAVLDRFGPDALLKLRFAPGTVELPMHVHEHSRRSLVVLNGQGFFHVASSSIAEFTGIGIHSIPVEPGDVVAFDRNVMHTFSAGAQGITLLSYHSPYIGLNDSRQYTVPQVLWYPPHMEPRDRFVA